MKKTRALCAAMALLICGVAHGQPLAADRLPREVAAFAEVRDMASLDRKLADFARQISRDIEPEPLTAVVPRSVLKTLDPASVDLSKPFQVVVLAPPLHTGPVIVFSVSDPARYLDSLMPAIRKERDEGDLHVFTTGEGPLVVGTVGNRAAMGSSLDAVRRVVSLLEAGSFSATPVFQDGDAGAAVRAKDLLDGLSAVGQDPFDILRSKLASGIIGLGGARSQAARQRVVRDMVLEGARAIASQLDVVEGTASLGPDAIVLATSARPVRGSGLERYVAGLPSGDMELLKYAPGDAMAVCAAKLGDLSPVIEFQRSVLERMTAGEPESADLPLAGLLQEAMAAVGDETMVAVRQSEAGPLSVTRAVKVKDADGMRRVVQSLSERLEDLAEGLARPAVPLGVKVNARNLSHAGRDITEWQVTVESVGPEQSPRRQYKVAMVEGFISEFWGEDASNHGAFIDDAYVFTFGTGSLARMQDLIDVRADSVVGSERLAAALSGMPGRPVAAGYLLLGELAEWYFGFLGRTVLRSAGVGAPAFGGIPFDSGPPIGFGTWIAADGVVEKRLRIPVGAIRAVVDGFKRMVMAPPPLEAP